MQRHRIWWAFVGNNCGRTCHTLHHILSLPSGPTGLMCAGMGSAGPDSNDAPTPRQGQNLTVQECVCSLLSPGLPSVSVLSFFSDASVHQWLMSPPRTRLIFHLQDASQLLSELSTSPHAWAHSSAHQNTSSAEAMWFLESPKTDVSHVSVSTWITSIQHAPHSFSFFLEWAEIQEWQISPDAVGLPPRFQCVLVKESGLYSICPTPFIAILKNTEIKKAVILCCQSPLCCSSCICSCLVLSIDGVGEAGASAGTIMLLHKLEKLQFLTHRSAFSWSWRWVKAE